MNTDGWELRVNPKSSSEILIYSNLEERKSIFVKMQHSSEAVTLLSAHRLLPLLLYSSDIVLHYMTSAVKSFLVSCHGLILLLDSAVLVLRLTPLCNLSFFFG